MGKIKRLAEHEAQKIAAGEVVERPANIIKELIENALDAGATHIITYVEDGGKQLIRVIDNGCGMSPDDAHMSIVHHATSKLSTIADLDTLQTFGFRGEALSSIAAISCMTIVTRENTAIEGYKLKLNGHQINHESIIGCQIGTDITVRDIFFNIPARKKFLKTRDTEWRAIHTLVQAFCLDYPQTTFTLYHDDKRILHCPPAASLKNRLEQLFDKQLTNALLFAEHVDANITIHAAFSDLHYLRYDRSFIFLFINKRWIKNPKISHAIVKAYATKLPPGRYPAAFIFMQTDPAHVDINIHPRKEEVQFLHPRKVEIAVETTIKSTLEKNLAHHFYQPTPTSPQQDISAYATMVAPTTKISQPLASQHNERARQDHTVFAHVLEQAFDKQQQIVSTTQPQEQQAILHQRYRLIGQLLTTYMLIETPDGLLLIDQHAAHERILYEQFANKLANVSTTTLIFPQIITMTTEDYQLIEPLFELFAQHGFAIETIGDNQLAVRSTPVMLQHINAQELIALAISWLHEHSTLDGQALKQAICHKLQAQMACKAAVKAGDLLSEEKMHELIAQLIIAPNRMTCPHGRPTSWLISHYEIERKFKRKL